MNTTALFRSSVESQAYLFLIPLDGSLDIVVFCVLGDLIVIDKK